MPAPEPALPAEMERMAHLAVTMLRKVLDAFATKESAAAEQLAADDDEVDRLYDRVETMLTQQMAQNPLSVA